MDSEQTIISLALWMPFLIGLRLFNMGISVLSYPIVVGLKVFFDIHIEPVSFWNVPLENRKQTLLVAFFLCAMPLSFLCYFFGFVLLIFPLTTFPMTVYLIFMFFDKSPETGSRRPFLRYWKGWRHFANYFPMRIVPTMKLSPKKKYVFCYHPHGVISVGAFGNFATDATGFSTKFPGIDIRVLTLGLNFKAPFMRELLLSVGMCSASKKACDQILQRGEGSAILLVVGGAQESLDSAPGTYRLTLSRQGFVRVALDNDACLVPVLGFGETDIFDSYVYGKGTLIRRLQLFFKKTFGFTFPVFHGRGIFNYTFGFLPFRKPIVAVIGPPLELPKCPTHLKGQNLIETAEGRELVNRGHQMYIKCLVGLYQDFKNVYNLSRSESLKIVANRNRQTRRHRKR